MDFQKITKLLQRNPDRTTFRLQCLARKFIENSIEIKSIV